MQNKKRMPKHNIKIGVNSPCLCGSKLKFKKCCLQFHNGKTPKTALELMRSRYVAYITSNSDYIIKTTHINNPDFTTDINRWKNDILEFCRYATFEQLNILEFIDGTKESFVSFNVKLTIDDKDESFTEKSKFLKVNNIWKYHSGEFNE